MNTKHAMKNAFECHSLLPRRPKSIRTKCAMLVPAGLVCVLLGFASPSLAQNSGLIAEVEQLKKEIAALKMASEPRFVPPGTIIAFGGDTNRIPSGWLLCDGKPLSSQQYANLFSAISTNWGAGIPRSTNNFNLPDLRGLFLRGVSGSRKDGWQDPDAHLRTNLNGGRNGSQVGSLQKDAVEIHSHQWGHITRNSTKIQRKVESWTSSSPRTEIVTILENTRHGGARGSAPSNDDYLTPINGASLYTSPTSTIGQSGETRPRNAYVYYLIKY